jgi:hypothetical protein
LSTQRDSNHHTCFDALPKSPPTPTASLKELRYYGQITLFFFQLKEKNAVLFCSPGAGHWRDKREAMARGNFNPDACCWPSLPFFPQGKARPLYLCT